MRVAMIGSGYVGLVSGACFADFGHTVVCIDKDPTKIERLNRGEIPIFEPGLDDLVETNVRDGRLSFTQDGAEAIRTADAVFIAVGTPSRRGDGHADLSYVHAAAEEIAGLIQGFTVIVTKSTVPVGTGDEVERMLRIVRIVEDRPLRETDCAPANMTDMSLLFHLKSRDCEGGSLCFQQRLGNESDNGALWQQAVRESRSDERRRGRIG